MDYKKALILFLLLVPLATAIDAPQWLQPVDGETGVDISSFRFHISEAPGVDGENVFADIEVYEQNTNQKIWEITNAAEYRISAPEGQYFQGKTALDFSTQYYAQSRYRLTNGTLSEWNQIVQFTTRGPIDQEQNQGDWIVPQGYKVETVLTNVPLPVTLQKAPQTIYINLPSNERPKLYFTELYGSISVLTADGQKHIYASNLLNFAPTDPIPGAGEVGLTGMYIDPTNGDLFASIVYNHPQGWGLFGKIEKFTSTDNGLTFTNREILLDMIPSAPAHHVHTITRGPDNRLYIQVGDDDQPSHSNDPTYLSGKIFSMNDDGTDVQIYASGFRNPYSGEWSPEGKLFISHNGPSQNDAIYKVQQGRNYGWDGEEQQKDTADLAETAWLLFPQVVAPTQLTFDRGNSIFTNEQGTLYATLYGPSYLQGPSERGKKIIKITRDTNGNYVSQTDFLKYNGDGYGTPVGVALLQDGVYFSDLYGEEGFTQTGVRGNIFRIVETNEVEQPPQEPPEDIVPPTPEDNTCYTTLENQQVTCEGGIITNDFYNGCRSIICSSDDASLEILACDKPTAENPEFFEMIVINNTNASEFRICIEEACLSPIETGYLVQNYPVCSESEVPAILPPSTPSLTLSLVSKTRLAINIQCQATNYVPTQYLYSYGNGISSTSSSNAVTYTYPEAGTYTVVCEAVNNQTNLSKTLEVSVANPSTSSSSSRSSGGGGGGFRRSTPTPIVVEEPEEIIVEEPEFIKEPTEEIAEVVESINPVEVQTVNEQETIDSTEENQLTGQISGESPVRISKKNWLIAGIIIVALGIMGVAGYFARK